MSNRIYSSSLLDMDYDAKNNLILYTWHPTTAEMTDREYQTEHLQIVHFSQKYGIANHLIDTRNFRYAIGLEMQEWANQNFYPPLIASGSKKFALLIPSDIFAQVSIEQTIEEGKVEGIVQTKYFQDISKAKSWLLDS